MDVVVGGGGGIGLLDDGGGVEPLVVVVGGGRDGLLDDGGGVEPFVVVELGEIFIGDCERERSDELAVDAITGGINLLTVDDSVVGYKRLEYINIRFASFFIPYLLLEEEQQMFVLFETILLVSVFH